MNLAILRIRDGQGKAPARWIDWQSFVRIVLTPIIFMSFRLWATQRPMYILLL